MLRRLARICTYGTVLCFTMAAWLAFSTSDKEQSSASESAPPVARPVTTTDSPGTPKRERDYTDLRIHRDATNHFAGEMTLHNPTNFDVQVLVTVNMYDGDQNVATCSA